MYDIRCTCVARRRQLFVVCCLFCFVILVEENISAETSRIGTGSMADFMGVFVFF